MREIDEIRAGLWDDRIRRGLENPPGDSPVDDAVVVDSELTAAEVEEVPSFAVVLSSVQIIMCLQAINPSNEEVPSSLAPSADAQIVASTSQETTDPVVSISCATRQCVNSPKSSDEKVDASTALEDAQETLVEALEVPNATVHGVGLVLALSTDASQTLCSLQKKRRKS